MPKILIVEDDLSNAEVIQLLLEDENYEVLSINKGNLLQSALMQSVPDLIIMDIVLGDQDGRRLSNLLKANGETMNIPIMLLTAMMESEATAVHCRANILMLKPFDNYSFLKTVKHLLTE